MLAVVNALVNIAFMAASGLVDHRAHRRRRRHLRAVRPRLRAVRARIVNDSYAMSPIRRDAAAAIAPR